MSRWLRLLRNDYFCYRNLQVENKAFPFERLKSFWAVAVMIKDGRKDGRTHGRKDGRKDG